MEEKVYIISDIEMGRGDIMDDFSDDEIVTNFVKKIAAENKDKKITLVLNGDIFDFLKMAYKDQYPRYITEKISLWKLEEVIKTHPKVFSGFREFVKNKNHILFFVIGNHDADLVWPSLQQRIREELNADENDENVGFNYWYEKNGVHVEHGHLLEPFFRINPKKAIIKFRGNEILNTPFGSQMCFKHLVHFKQKFSKDEQYFPKPLAFKKNPQMNREKNGLMKKVLLRDLIWNPLWHWNDPTYRIPYFSLLDHFLHYGLNVIDDDKFFKRITKRALRKYPDQQCIVLGHLHLFKKDEREGKQILVTDTWRNEYDLTNNLQKKTKSYGEISLLNSKIVTSSLNIYKS